MKGKYLALTVIVALNVCLLGALVFVLAHGFDTALPVASAFITDARAEAPAANAVSAAELTPGPRAIPEGVTVNGAAVGGLTRDEAVKALAHAFPAHDGDITVFFEAQTWRLLPSDFSAGYDFSRAVGLAETAGKGEMIAMPVTADAAAIDAQVELIAGQVYAAPANPAMTKDENGFTITPGAFGRTLDTAKLARELKHAAEAALSGAKANVYAETLPVPPDCDEASLMAAQDLLGTYVTKFNSTQTNRNQNIKTASDRINNRVVLPGEVFSTNREFGPTTYDNGYRMAGTYQSGKVVEGMGGGMCQVSTTLYVALLYAELEIVERTNHSMPVAYVDLSFDATLAGDYIDMKFKNDTDYPVLIEAIMTTNTLTVNIYGHETRPAGRELKFEKALVASTPPAAELVTQDPSLPFGERVVDVAEKTGYQYQLYKLAYQGGQFVDKTKVNTSTYRPVRGEVRLGVGPAATPQPAQPAVTEPAVTAPPESHVTAAPPVIPPPVIEPAEDGEPPVTPDTI